MRLGVLALAVLAVSVAAWSGAMSSTTLPGRVGVSGQAGVAGMTGVAGVTRPAAVHAGPAGPGRTASGPAVPALPRATARELGVVTAPRPGGPTPPDPTPPAPAPPDGGGSCGPFDLSACVSDAVTTVMQNAVTSLLNPALNFLGETLLATPTLDQLPRVAELWHTSWDLALACYSTLILVGGLIIMGHQTIQTRYAARDIAPRLVVGLIAGSVSLPLVSMAIDIANSASRSILGTGVDPVAGAGGLRDLLTQAVLGGTAGALGLALVGLGVVVALIAVLCGWILRVSVLVCLIAAAPLILMWHALPHTNAVARWWWKATAGCLLIQVLQSLVLVVGLRILLVPGQAKTSPFGTQISSSGLVTMLVLLVLLWLLWKIPGWVWRSWVGGGPGPMAWLGSMLKTAVAFKTAGLLSSAVGGLFNGSKKPPAKPEEDVNKNVPVGGQLAFQIRAEDLPRTPRHKLSQRFKPIPGEPEPEVPGSYVGNGFAEYVAPPRPWERPGFVAKGQQALPLDEGIWPEHRPIAGRDGQWRLPIDAPRVPRAERVSGPAPGPQPAPWERDGFVAKGQYALPLAEGIWPEHRPVAGRDGQWRLPIDVRRVPRSELPPRPAPDPTIRPWERDGFVAKGQYALPLAEGIWPEHRPVAGRDGQWRLPIDVPRVPRSELPPRPAPAPTTRPWERPGFVAKGQYRLPPSPRPVRSARPGRRPPRES